MATVSLGGSKHPRSGGGIAPSQPAGVNWRKVVLSLAIFGHLVAIFLNAFPWSPFIAKLYPYYRGYIDVSGQAQIWHIYRSPLRFNPRFEIVALDGNGQVSHPFGHLEEWSPRKLYFVEAVSIADREFSAALLQHIANQRTIADVGRGVGGADSDPNRLREVNLRVLRAPAPPHGEARRPGNFEYKLEKEIRLSL